MADGGYDVADHCDIDRLFGTLADADALIADAHATGIRILIDIVPNHTSTEHAWFRAALAAGLRLGDADLVALTGCCGRWRDNNIAKDLSPGQMVETIDVAVGLRAQHRAELGDIRAQRRRGPVGRLAMPELVG
jgi:hypothetical protein